MAQLSADSRSLLRWPEALGTCDRAGGIMAISLRAVRTLPYGIVTTMIDDDCDASLTEGVLDHERSTRLPPEDVDFLAQVTSP